MSLQEDILLMKNRAVCRSYGKINLTLDVLGKRSDGYHDVEMVMQTVNIFDLVIVDKTPASISVSSNVKFLPDNHKNIAYQAADLFFRRTGITGGAKILIHKNIPISAGLAGGSGNAAAVLCALNLLYNHPLTADTLLELASQLGADVPFCIRCGTALASGIGDILTPLPSLPRTALLLVKPNNTAVSTPDIYRAIDNVKIPKHPDTKAMISAIESGNMDAVCAQLYNVMEPVTARIYPQITAIKEEMLAAGAIGAVMSGSGPTVFGLFRDTITAKKAADQFSDKFREVFACTTI